MKAKIKKMKTSDFFRLKDSETSTVWVRGEYDRSLKKYSTHKFDDANHERFVSPNLEVFTEFDF